MTINKPFTASERAELKQMGLTLTQLNKRYNLARQRASARSEGILPTYDFYRELIKQLKEMAKKLNTTEKALFYLVDIHSIEGYKVFKLMLRQEHKLLHSTIAKKKAQEILNRGTLTCRHCKNTKPLTEMIKSTKALCGYITTCKACDKKLRAERKALREVA